MLMRLSPREWPKIGCAQVFGIIHYESFYYYLHVYDI